MKTSMFMGGPGQDFTWLLFSLLTTSGPCSLIVSGLIGAASVLSVCTFGGAAGPHLQLGESLP